MYSRGWKRITVNLKFYSQRKYKKKNPTHTNIFEQRSGEFVTGKPALCEREDMQERKTSHRNGKLGGNYNGIFACTRKQVTSRKTRVWEFLGLTDTASPRDPAGPPLRTEPRETTADARVETRARGPRAVLPTAARRGALAAPAAGRGGTNGRCARLCSETSSGREKNEAGWCHILRDKDKGERAERQST